MIRQQPMEALAAANAAGIEAMRNLAFSSIKATERLMSLNLDFARNSLRLGADCARPAANSADWRQVISQQNSGLQKGAEEAAIYLRSVYDISAEAQAEMGELISARVDDFSESVNSMMDALSKSAPAGSDKAIEFMRTAFATSCSACVQMVRNSQQVTANVQAVTPRKTRRNGQ